jgi:hypothetical protein
MTFRKPAVSCGRSDLRKNIHDISSLVASIVTIWTPPKKQTPSRTFLTLVYHLHGLLVPNAAIRRWLPTRLHAPCNIGIVEKGAVLDGQPRIGFAG